MSPSFERFPTLGSAVRSFRLPEPLTGRAVAPEDYPDARALLVAFLANRCPHVLHLAEALARVARDFDGLGLQVLGVNSRDGDQDPAEAPAAVAAEALRRRYIFPYLIDQTQGVARVYGARCTPDFYLFDRDRRLFYHGCFDTTRFGGRPRAHGGDLRRAILRTLDGAPPPEHQVASQGSMIAWRESLRPRGRPPLEPELHVR